MQDWDGDSDDEGGGEGGGLNDTAPGFVDQSEVPFSLDTTAQPASQLLVLAGDNLVTQPRKVVFPHTPTPSHPHTFTPLHPNAPTQLQVQRILIDYAKTAKKLDIKKLKGTMWGIIQEGERNVEEEEGEEEEEEVDEV